jgi:hypothetical protein
MEPRIAYVILETTIEIFEQVFTQTRYQTNEGNALHSLGMLTCQTAHTIPIGDV